MNLIDFWHIGREQHSIKPNWGLRLFYWALGALDMHARIRIAHMISAIEQAHLPRTTKILDAGFGQGMALFALARRFPRWHVDGVELIASDVAVAQRIAQQQNFENVTLRQADLQHLTTAQVYDAVFSIDVLEHIPDDEGTLHNMWQALKPGGQVFIHVPLNRFQQQRIFPQFAHHEVDDHARLEYTEDEIRDKVQKAGFEIEYIHYTFSPWGELAWEVNNLFWLPRLIMRMISLSTFPLSLILGYADVVQSHTRGNSLLVKAIKE